MNIHSRLNGVGRLAIRELDSLAMEAVSDSPQRPPDPAIVANPELFNEPERRFIASCVRWLKSASHPDWVLEEIRTLLWPEATASTWKTTTPIEPVQENGAGETAETHGDQRIEAPPSAPCEGES